MQALNHLLKAQADIKRRQLSHESIGRRCGRQRQSQLRHLDAVRPRAAAPAADQLRDAEGRRAAAVRRRGFARPDQGPGAPAGRTAPASAGAGAHAPCRPGSAHASSRSSRASSPSCVSAPRSWCGKCQSLSRSPISPRSRATAPARTARRMDRRPAAAATATANRCARSRKQMRQAASDLRRGAPEQAGASDGRALEKLRDLERRMQSGQPDDRRRALGDMRLEARQLADGQRQVASDLGKVPSGEAGKDTLRRLAGDQARLADRLRAAAGGFETAGGDRPARERRRPEPGWRVARLPRETWPDLRIACSEPPTHFAGRPLRRALPTRRRRKISPDSSIGSPIASAWGPA